MSKLMTSPQQRAAGENAEWQSALQKQLWDVAGPQLQGIMGPGGTLNQMLSGMDVSGRLPQDTAALKSATDQLNRGYGQAAFGNQEYMNYAGLRSGEGRVSPGAMTGALGGMATSLERDRTQALANLNFMSAQSSMGDYNKLLGLMGQGVQSSLGLGGGFAGASNAAIGGLSNQSPFGTALGAVTGIGSLLLSPSLGIFGSKP